MTFLFNSPLYLSSLIFFLLIDSNQVRTPRLKEVEKVSTRSLVGQNQRETRRLLTLDHILLFCIFDQYIWIENELVAYRVHQPTSKKTLIRGPDLRRSQVLVYKGNERKKRTRPTTASSTNSQDGLVIRFLNLPFSQPSKSYIANSKTVPIFLKNCLLYNFFLPL